MDRRHTVDSYSAPGYGRRAAQAFSHAAERTMLLGRRHRRSKGSATAETMSLYYASDVHGSERCWRKFLGAGRFYGVRALVMGGDLTGKAIVPVEVEESGAFST